MEFFQVIVFVCNLAYATAASPDGDCSIRIKDEFGAKYSGYSGLYVTKKGCENRKKDLVAFTYNMYNQQLMNFKVKSSCPKVFPGQKI